MSDELKAVYTAMDEADAEVVRLALESTGVECFLENANQAGLAGVLPVKVLVRASDVDAAKAFVAEHEQSGPSSDDSEPAEH